MINKITYLLELSVGIMLIIFGANNFLGFIPIQPGTEAMGVYLKILAQAGMLLSIVAVIQIITGICFVFNRYKLLSTLILLPIIGNAFSAHFFFNDYAGIAPSFFILLVLNFILYRNRMLLKPLLGV